MKLIGYQDGSGKEKLSVTFNGKYTTIDRVWDVMDKFRGLNEHDEHFLVLSNSNQVMLYFTGTRADSHFYIQGITPLNDKPFTLWKSLQRLLGVKYLELVTGPTNASTHQHLESLGLEWVTKRVVFSVNAPERFESTHDCLQLQENSSLEEITSLCELVKAQLPNATDILSNAAQGLVNVQMFMDDGKVVSALFFGEFNHKRYVSEAFVCAHRTGTEEYTREFIRHFRGMLSRCAEEKREFSVALAAEANIPEYDGIQHEVVTYHYTFA